MSVHVSSRVWATCPAHGGDLLVMLALADFCNDEGECWPSMKSLCVRTRMTDRGCQLAMKRLIDAGELEATRGGGRGRTNTYRLARYANTEPRSGNGAGNPEQHSVNTPNPEQDSVNVVPETPNIATLNPEHRDTPTTYEPSVNHQEPSEQRGVETAPPAPGNGTEPDEPHWAAGSPAFNGIADALAVWLDVNPYGLHPATQKALRQATRIILHRGFTAEHVALAEELWYSEHWRGKDTKRDDVDRRPNVREAQDWFFSVDHRVRPQAVPA